jgi:acyl carrier protein
MEIKDILRNFIVESTFTPADQVKNDTLIFVQGIFDSMGFISLINFLEEHFSIKADDSELLEENFESINAITNYIQRKLQ